MSKKIIITVGLTAVAAAGGAAMSTVGAAMSTVGAAAPKQQTPAAKAAHRAALSAKAKRPRAHSAAAKVAAAFPGLAGLPEDAESSEQAHRANLKRLVGDDTLKFKLARKIDGTKFYVGVGRTSVCLDTLYSDGSRQFGCAPIDSATDPSTPLGVTSYDDATGVTTATMLLPQGAKNLRVAGNASDEPVNGIAQAKAKADKPQIAYDAPDGSHTITSHAAQGK